jgi:hypothetical protein
MAAREGAKRMGQAANIMLTLSLLTILLPFRLSLALFIGGWLVYGAARIIDGFTQSEHTSPEAPPYPR